MRISVIGSGRMGAGIVTMLARFHDELIWAGRDPAAIAAKIDERGLQNKVTAAGHAEALQADIIMLALWHRDMPAFIDRYRSQLAGKVVVDMANPFTADFSDFTTPWETSAAEELQRLAPEARIVGAFKSSFWVVFDDPAFPEGEADCFVTSDDADAKALVIEALSPLPFRVLDGGRLSNSRTIERMTLFAREVAGRYGFYPRIAWRLLGQEQKGGSDGE